MGGDAQKKFVNFLPFVRLLLWIYLKTAFTKLFFVGVIYLFIYNTGITKSGSNVE